MIDFIAVAIVALTLADLEEKTQEYHCNLTLIEAQYSSSEAEKLCHKMLNPDIPVSSLE